MIEIQVPFMLFIFAQFSKRVLSMYVLEIYGLSFMPGMVTHAFIPRS